MNRKSHMACNFNCLDFSKSQVAMYTVSHYIGNILKTVQDRHCYYYTAAISMLFKVTLQDHSPTAGLFKCVYLNN